MITIHTEIHGLRDILGRYTRTDISDIAHRELGGVRDRAVALTRDEAPARTGELRRGIHASIRRNPIRLDVFSPVPYTTYVLKGTKPHTIFPRFARVLRFAVGGKIVFARRMRHPGTRPNRFDARAFGRLLPELTAAAQRIKARTYSALGGH